MFLSFLFRFITTIYNKRNREHTIQNIKNIAAVKIEAYITNCEAFR